MLFQCNLPTCAYLEFAVLYTFLFYICIVQLLHQVHCYYAHPCNVVDACMRAVGLSAFLKSLRTPSAKCHVYVHFVSLRATL